MIYYRPLVQTGPARPPEARTLAGGWGWFTHAEGLSRDGPPRVVSAQDIPDAWCDRLCSPRADVAGLSMDAPRIMAILNVTPDSFSDGGRFDAPEAAGQAARALIDAGADILDVGGESTRPGAAVVDVASEIERVVPAIRAARGVWGGAISIDTRKAAVARAAVGTGATMLNDVAAMGFDPAMGPLAAETGLPICLMHASGDPETMQRDPRYDHVTLDVFDFLADHIAEAEAHGVARARIVVDPGIGFGKTLEHNLTLLRDIAVFHGLGVPVLLGASRKSFIGTLTDTPQAAARMPGSVAVALGAIARGVQIVRVHDMEATRQALTLWRATEGASR